MFLKQFFNSHKAIIEAEIKLSDSSFLSISSTSSNASDKELTIMGLLIFARVLRIEVSNEEKNRLTNFFIEFHNNYVAVDNKIQFLDAMMEVFRLLSKPHKGSDSTKIKIKSANYLFLDMGRINVYPITSIVFTTFVSLWNIVGEKNQVRLSESFCLLAKKYLDKPFSISEANEIPNKVATDVYAKSN
jgi:hypothetical protein